ncbi:MAG TPA: hypothetical protein VE505_15735 [Vicinamibacterales bacterium]|nr:hypothetical protein [Vicinamibacterales bacterium]
MAAISGSITVFYLFDVAQAIDLSAVPALVGVAPAAARLAPKPATPPYVQYAKPPLLLEGSAIQAGTISGLTPRFKLFDYGVVSLALSRPFTGGWPELIAAGQPLIDGDPLAHEAEVCCRRLLARLSPALIHANDRFLAEDYVVFAATHLEQPATAEALLRAHGGEIAQLLRGERQALSPEERERVLRHRISYLADDLVVPTWNAALVRDTEAGAQAAMEILEFANSQLLEFRHYDSLLDSELTRLYAELQKPRPVGLLRSRRYTRAAHHVHALLIDVHELTDHTENAIKFVGDMYAARLFGVAASRLGLDRWKASVQEKLQTMNLIYGFAVEQASVSRGELLELTIVLLIVLEVVLFLVGVSK